MVKKHYKNSNEKKEKRRDFTDSVKNNVEILVDILNEILRKMWKVTTLLCGSF
jgi:hypothetical protein